jgi:hypothetical protein
MNDMPQPIGDLEAFLSAKAAEIRAYQRVAVFETGRVLSEVRARTPHGRWLAWLDEHFGWSDDTAGNYLNVFEAFSNGSKYRSLRDLSFTNEALYLLARRSTPEEARDAAVERAEAGERVTKADAEKIVEEVRKARETLAEVEALTRGARERQAETVKQVATAVARKVEAESEASAAEAKARAAEAGADEVEKRVASEAKRKADAALKDAAKALAKAEADVEEAKKRATTIEANARKDAEERLKGAEVTININNFSSDLAGEIGAMLQNFGGNKAGRKLVEIIKYRDHLKDSHKADLVRVLRDLRDRCETYASALLAPRIGNEK